jgi:hypothetical protein
VALVEQAVRREINRPQFVNGMTLIVLEALLEAFLIGAGVEGEEDLPPEALAELHTMRQQAEASIGEFATAIYTMPQPEPEEEDETLIGLLARATLWTVSLAGAFGGAQLWHSKQDQHMQWRLGGTIEHCTDCARLDKQVHTRRQWRQSPWRPQGRMLECGGWNCDCGLFAVDLPLVGAF